MTGQMTLKWRVELGPVHGPAQRPQDRFADRTEGREARALQQGPHNSCTWSIGRAPPRPDVDNSGTSPPCVDLYSIPNGCAKASSPAGKRSATRAVGVHVTSDVAGNPCFTIASASLAAREKAWLCRRVAVGNMRVDGGTGTVGVVRLTRATVQVVVYDPRPTIAVSIFPM